MNIQGQTTTMAVAVIRNDAETVHTLEDIFQTYVVWKTLPAMLKNPPMDRKSGERPSVEDFCEAMGIDDPIIIETAKIKNMTQFCEVYNVDKSTLTRWNKEIAARDPMADLRTWAIKLSKNVLMGLYNNAIRKGMAMEAKLWFQLVNQWNEKSVVEHDYKGVKSITYEVIEPTHATHGDKKEDQPETSPSAQTP